MRVLDSAGRLKTAYGGVLGTSDGQIPENIGGVMTGVPVPNNVFDFRLTPSTGVPVTTSDVTGATDLYLSPYKGNRIALYDGTRWVIRSSAEITLALGTVVKYQAYDVFCYDNAGTPTLEKLEWANAAVTMTIAAPGVVTWTAHGMVTGNSITFTTTGALPTGLAVDTQYFVTVVSADTFKLSTTRTLLGAGTFITTSGSQSGTHTGHQPQARATALTTQDGVLVKSGDATRRYCGSFLAYSTTQTKDTVLARFVYNYYHRVRRSMLYQEATSSWTYAVSNVWRPKNAADTQIEAFNGYNQTADLQVRCTIGASATAGSVGIGVNSATQAVGTWGEAYISANSINNVATGEARVQASVGYTWYEWLEIVRPGTTAFYGTASVTDIQSGMHGSVDA